MDTEKLLIDNMTTEQLIAYAANELQAIDVDMKKCVEDQNLAFAGKSYARFLMLQSLLRHYQLEKLAEKN